MTTDSEIIRLRTENSRLLACALVREVPDLLDTAIADLAAALIRDHGLEFISGRPIFIAGGNLSDAVEAARAANPHYFKTHGLDAAQASALAPRPMSASAKLALANGEGN
ncbi:hypothetical protein [Brevundimonas sp. DWR2-3-1b1]|uniref:hypothetical protein n=1 Tax=unclassified Brevundimonas TaxID=2622653 RepID=UPI003CE79FF2